MRLPRGSGQKEDRYGQVLGGPVHQARRGGEPEAVTGGPAGGPSPAIRGEPEAAGPDEVAALRAEVGQLRAEVEALRRALDDLREQLGA